MSEKTEAEALQEQLAICNEHFLKQHADEIDNVDAFCEGYKAFLQRAKTERECNSALRRSTRSAATRPATRSTLTTAASPSSFA